jgi:hypothetical protein
MVTQEQGESVSMPPSEVSVTDRVDTAVVESDPAGRLRTGAVAALEPWLRRLVPDERQRHPV